MSRDTPEYRSWSEQRERERRENAKHFRLAHPACTCEEKWDSVHCSRIGCDNVICEAHGGEYDGDVDDEGRPVNASLCGTCLKEWQDA